MPDCPPEPVVVHRTQGLPQGGGQVAVGPRRAVPGNGLEPRTHPIIRPITWAEPHGQEAPGRTNNPYAASLLGLRRTPKTAGNGLQIPVKSSARSAAVC